MSHTSCIEIWKPIKYCIHYTCISPYSTTCNNIIVCMDRIFESYIMHCKYGCQYVCYTSPYSTSNQVVVFISVHMVCGRISMRESYIMHCKYGCQYVCYTSPYSTSNQVVVFISVHMVCGRIAMHESYIMHCKYIICVHYTGQHSCTRFTGQENCHSSELKHITGCLTLLYMYDIPDCLVFVLAVAA